MSVFGIDHAWGVPSNAALKAARAKFVVRYLSHDSGKNLTRAEADLRTAAGIDIAVIWETTASRAMSGRAGGAADATEAARQAAACGMPVDRPIYFAVDWDAQPNQQADIHAYLDGAASVLTRARVGLYAGYGPIKRAFDAGKITFGWQTYAWSGGRWDPRAQLQQYLNGQRVGGVDCDFNRAMKNDFGQWRVGVTPTNGGLNMTPDEVFAAVWNTDKLPSPGTDPKNPTWQPSSYLTDIDGKVRALQAKVDALSADIAAIKAAVVK